VTDLLFVGLVILAALACPAHMWWQHRRGRQSACCPPRKPAPSDLQALRARRDQIEAQLSEFEVASPSARTRA
jgi:uncharacterized iron-regulated membrane protein